jgi:hypothetical protein
MVGCYENISKISTVRNLWIFNSLRHYQTFEGITCNIELGILDSVVCVLTKLWAGRSGVRIPAGSRNLSLLHNFHTSFMGHQTSYLMDTGALCPR